MPRLSGKNILSVGSFSWVNPFSGENKQTPGRFRDTGTRSLAAEVKKERVFQYSLALLSICQNSNLTFTQTQYFETINYC